MQPDRPMWVQVSLYSSRAVRMLPGSPSPPSQNGCANRLTWEMHVRVPGTWRVLRWVLAFFMAVNSNSHWMAELEWEKCKATLHLPQVHRFYGSSGVWFGKCSVSASSPLDKWQSLETQKGEERQLRLRGEPLWPDMPVGSRRGSNRSTLVETMRGISVRHSCAPISPLTDLEQTPSLQLLEPVNRMLCSSMEATPSFQASPESPNKARAQLSRGLKYTLDQLPPLP